MNDMTQPDWCRMYPETRRCPTGYTCPDSGCARLESDDESVWADDIIRWEAERVCLPRCDVFPTLTCTPTREECQTFCMRQGLPE